MVIGCELRHSRCPLPFPSIQAILPSPPGSKSSGVCIAFPLKHSSTPRQADAHQHGDHGALPQGAVVVRAGPQHKPLARQDRSPQRVCAAETEAAISLWSITRRARPFLVSCNPVSQRTPRIEQTPVCNIHWQTHFRSAGPLMVCIPRG